MPRSEVVAVAYRLHAAMCIEIAERTSDLKNRLVLLKMAATWLTLAAQAEKNSRVYKIRSQSRFSSSNNPESTSPKRKISANCPLRIISRIECVPLKLGGPICQC